MSWFSRLQNAMFSRRLDDDLAEEMRDHLKRRAAELELGGIGPEEALRRAALRFGNGTQIRERSRDIRLWGALETTLQDLRYAWRGMRRSPAMATTAVLSLALAIGASTAIYSIVDAAILRALPVPQPDRLISLASPPIVQPGEEMPDERDSFTYPMYMEFRKSADWAARLALVSYVNRVEVTYSDNSEPIEKLNRVYISADAFQIFGVSAALGRVLRPEDDLAPGASPVAVLSYDYWQRRFDGDPHVLGKSMHMDTGEPNTSLQIVGVARKGFFGVEPGRFVDVWLPASMYNKEAFANPGWSWFRIVGRLAPGVTAKQIQARLQPVFHRYAIGTVQRMPIMPAVIKAQFVNARLRVRAADVGVSDFRRTYARPLWIVLAVAGAIFLVACANVASLLLARGTTRAGEMAMRISLGAGKGRLVRQLLTENLLLAALAGALGWLVARAAAPLLVRLLSNESNPVQLALAINTRVLLFGAAVSALATICFGLLPAWQAAGAQPMKALRGMTGQTSRLRMGRAFVAVQVAFAFCLVVVGTAFLFSLWNLFSVKTGFDARDVTVLDVSNQAARGNEKTQRANMLALADGLREMPGTHGVAMAPWAIFAGSSWTDQVIVPGKGPSEREELFYRVSPDYFGTLRTPLLYGRDFKQTDEPHGESIVAIVNVDFARKYLGGEDVVGATFDRMEGKKRVLQRVVGVVANAHYGSLRKGAEPIVYLPIEGASFFAVFVRSELDVGSVVRQVQAATKRAGSGLRVRDITTLNTLVGNTILREKLLADIGATFAALGVALATLGVFGMLNYSVVRRNREIGIRAALGAQRAELVGLVMKDLAGMVAAGLITGWVGSLGILLALRSLFFGLKTLDPEVLGTALLVFLISGVIAAGVPARRVASIDPMVTLRQE